jgi:hypothetical protein
MSLKEIRKSIKEMSLKKIPDDPKLKRLFQDIQEGDGPILGDNVGCFLKLMKFDAIVFLCDLETLGDHLLPAR